MTKHTILFLAANPVGTDRLALDKEARAIQVELERSSFRDSFALQTRWAAEPLDLLRELRKLKPTVVHFSGHGAYDVAGVRRGAEGPHRDVVVETLPADLAQHGLYFQGPDGHPQVVSAEALADVFGAAGSSVKLVTLNACYSDPQAAGLAAHVDCVVGMRGSIRDDAARGFAIGFYGGLGERESVAAAYRQGCAAIGLEGLPDGDKPRIRVRDGIDAEQVVLADLAGGDPTAQSRGLVSPPTPAYANAEVQALSEQLEDARARKQNLRDAGIATDEVDREILELRRKLREGGQLRSGDSLGDDRYLLVKLVGSGGFAVVWEAWDRAEQQHVAIKVLHANLAGDPQRRERFSRGAQAMRKLVHPAVVRVLEPSSEDGGFYYFVMELVPGGNLREVVLEKRVQRDDVLPLILQVGEALALAHARGMIHRDIKPANILLDEHGNAKLTDFDLVSAPDTTGGTRTGALGTIVYAAPECLDKPQEATARADVYGLGMTAVFCLAGKDLSLSALRNPDPMIAELDCSAAVRNVLQRAVAWEPDARFADARALVAELRSALVGRDIEPAHGASSAQLLGTMDQAHDAPSDRSGGGLQPQPQNTKVVERHRMSSGMRDRYTIIERLESLDSGMAEMFRGVAESMEGFKKSVAIKRILPNLTKDQKFVSMFLDEARLSLFLQHANIVQVFDISRTPDNAYFLVMEYVDGCNLKGLIERQKQKGKRIDIGHSVYLMIECCEALQYAHSLDHPETGRPLGIVHRSISPPNILLSKNGEIKLVDFGIAKATSQIESTDPGVVKGKFSYLSPEAASGRAVDHRADVFAVGIILWELFTGRRLFYGDSDYHTVELVRQARVPSIAALNPEIDAELEQVVRKALARDPDDRYQDANDLGDALAQFLFSRRMRVTPRDIARLVRDTQVEMMRKRSAEPKDSLIDDLILDEMRKMSSLFDGSAGETPTTEDAMSLDPSAFFDTWSQADTTILQRPSAKPRSSRLLLRDAVAVSTLTPEIESLESILEPDRRSVHKKTDRPRAWILIILCLAAVAAVGIAAAIR